MTFELQDNDIDRIVAALRKNDMGLSLVAKWVLGIAASILTVVLTAQATAISRMSTDIALLQKDVANLGKTIESKMSDRFTGSDARAMRDLYDLRFQSVADQLDGHADRITALEKGKS